MSLLGLCSWAWRDHRHVPGPCSIRQSEPPACRTNGDSSDGDSLYLLDLCYCFHWLCISVLSYRCPHWILHVEIHKLAVWLYMATFKFIHVRLFLQFLINFLVGWFGTMINGAYQRSILGSASTRGYLFFFTAEE